MSQEHAAETRTFDTEVHQLLKLMINALYSNREIFLRELISNASDASDKLRFEALTSETLKGRDQDLRITIAFDAEAGTLSVRDRGIGMNRQEVIDNLGTIARSGTRRFIDSLSGDQKEDARLIGQFGVGFYAAFIVADEVVVETRRADEPADAGVRWTSKGEGEYRVETIEREGQGTEITLHLRPEHTDLLDRWALERIIRHYSNHVAFPIELEHPKQGDEEGGVEVVNDSQALWTRPKNELSDEDYKSFYRGLGLDASDPVSWAHHRVEGSQSYSLLLYLPGQAPFDMLINRDEREGLKLYIQRVFIMDAAEQLLPRYLRFMRGVVDSADLPLNVSRELLQDSPLLKKIRATVVKRSLDLIEKLAKEGGEDWTRFWNAFGSILKEGVIEDHVQRERIASLLRFASTSSDDDAPTIGLDDYIGRMGDDQDSIWYLTADSLRVARSSPHLEAFKARDIEVLLLTDRIDEWLVSHLSEYKGKALNSVARNKLETDGTSQEPDEQARSLAERIKQALGDRVEEVRPASGMTRSPARLLADEHGISLQMLKLMRQAGQDVPDVKPNLEVNPGHRLLQAMAAEADGERFNDLSRLLLDQAVLAEGGELDDPAAYLQRVNSLLIDALEGPSAPAEAASAHGDA
ncbi:molecular chaperone HtpG [Leptolyngbya valderiana BDU 20041]|nr:molecular chaperone HtpG [Leptolyngbya valderiana BDU 20041]